MGRLRYACAVALRILVDVKGAVRVGGYLRVVGRDVEIILQEVSQMIQTVIVED